MNKLTIKLHFEKRKKTHTQTLDREVEIKEDSSMSVYNLMQLESDSTGNCNVITLLQFRRPPHSDCTLLYRGPKENDRDRTACERANG